MKIEGALKWKPNLNDSYFNDILFGNNLCSHEMRYRIECFENLIKGTKKVFFLFLKVIISRKINFRKRTLCNYKLFGPNDIGTIRSFYEVLEIRWRNFQWNERKLQEPLKITSPKVIYSLIFYLDHSFYPLTTCPKNHSLNKNKVFCSILFVTITFVLFFHR